MRASPLPLCDIRRGDDGVTGWLHWVAVGREYQGRGLSKPLII